MHSAARRDERARAGGRAIACGLATTKQERTAVLGQRFRVYQRRGYEVSRGEQRLLRALQRAGVALHEIQPASVISSKDGPTLWLLRPLRSGRAVYWLTDEIGPFVERAVARYHEVRE